MTMTMKMKKHTIGKIGSVAAAAMAFAALPSTGLRGETSANVTATSNYVWRGATQNDDSAAIQGGFDYADPGGFYAGTWASNVDFGGGGEVEWDLYGGYSGEVENFGYDFGLIGYLYPDSDDADFYELSAAFSYLDFSFGLNYTISSDVSDTAAAEGFIDGDLYYYAGASFDLGDGFGLGATVGSYAFEDDGVGGAELDYTHFQLDLSKSTDDMGSVTLSASWAEEEANAGDDDLKIFVSWGTEF